MVTKRQKQVRETKQVRVSVEWHRRLKIEAAEKGTTVTKLLDAIAEERYKIKQTPKYGETQ